MDEYTSHIFEIVCREYLRRQNKINQLPFHFTKIGRCWNKTDELDIMATNKDKNKFIIGECKFKNSAFNLSELQSTIAKFKPKKKTAKIYYYMFSKSGFTDEVIRQSKQMDVMLVTIDEML